MPKERFQDGNAREHKKRSLIVFYVLWLLYVLSTATVVCDSDLRSTTKVLLIYLDVSNNSISNLKNMLFISTAADSAWSWHAVNVVHDSNVEVVGEVVKSWSFAVGDCHGQMTSLTVTTTSSRWPAQHCLDCQLYSPLEVGAEVGC